ncbi:MAG TPA: type II toxin-antitoxin system VapC family toxin [Blastocatellia bacterium]|nr:type II toxin-antitoxin system VapC family toxin [Blastocatellia bacterium]
MAYLTDTNILLRIVEPLHSMHTQAAGAVGNLIIQGETLCLLPQNLIEFWNVCTRPADKNGLGFSLQETEAHVAHFESAFTLLPDTPAIYQEWRRLVVRYSVSGVQVHDARIVAAMNAHGISHLLTFNVRDFARYQGITVVAPQDV